MVVYLERTINVLLTEGVRLAGAVHELVHRVDALHIFHDTEGKVGMYPRSVLHEVDGLGQEAVDFALGTLAATGEALAGKLSNHKRQLESIVPELHVGNETRRAHVVVVQGLMGWLASAIARLVPIFHPLHSIGVGAGNWGEQHGITLGRQGFDILLPKVGGFARTHVGLAWFVRLIWSHHAIGVASLDKLGKLGDLISTPQHGHALDTILFAVGIQAWTPSIKISYVVGHPRLEGQGYTVGPGKTNLASRPTPRSSGGDSLVGGSGMRRGSSLG